MMDEPLDYFDAKSDNVDTGCTFVMEGTTNPSENSWQITKPKSINENICEQYNSQPNELNGDVSTENLEKNSNHVIAIRT